MATAAPQLHFTTDFDPETGQLVAIAPGIARLTAPNRSPYTFTGTNSFLLGTERLFVVDPGPEDKSHFEALLRAIGGHSVEAILLTHTHRDHSDLAQRLRAATGAPLWFHGKHRLSRPLRRFEFNPIRRSSDWTLDPDRVLRDGERLAAGAMEIEVLATPGHCANHLSFGIAGTPYLLSGDHVMGWNSTLVSVPDGSMADYLRSLERLEAASYTLYLPAHGGPIPDGRAYARALCGHRQMRNTQILEQVGRGTHSIGGLLRAIYPKLSPALLPAARMTLEAHVEYLEQHGELRVSRSLFGTRLFPAS
jgi:glyoxylase-like metal-dependent hydrolase (beta-lactamase superfamily II)